jgi:hypothetical protein
MLAPYSWRDRLSSLLTRGCEVDAITHTTDEYNVESAIEHFKFAAENDPDFLLRETMAMSGSTMVPLSIAILFSCAPDAFLNDYKNRYQIQKILSDKVPSQLLECAEIIKSKSFGRGLGSRPQKAIRTVMESWTSADLEEFSIGQPRALYALIRLIHPRYNEYRGEIIRSLLSGKFKR